MSVLLMLVRVMSWFNMMGMMQEMMILQTELRLISLLLIIMKQVARVTARNDPPVTIQTLELKGLMIAVHLG